MSTVQRLRNITLDELAYSKFQSHYAANCSYLMSVPLIHSIIN